MEGEVERGEGGVGAYGVEEEGDGRALALGGSLGQVFDDGLEDLEVPGEDGGGILGGWGLLVGLGMGQKGLKVLGVEALGVEAVAEGVSVARLSAAAWGGRVFLPGTNRERIGGGHRGKGLLWALRGGGMEHLV